MKNKNGREADTATFKYLNSNKIINAGYVTTFSEFSVVSSNRVTKFSKNFDFKIASLMGCCLTTGIGTVINQSKVRGPYSLTIANPHPSVVITVMTPSLAIAHPSLAVTTPSLAVTTPSLAVAIPS